MVGAGFEGDIGRGPPCLLPGHFKGLSFGVGPAPGLGPANS